MNNRLIYINEKLVKLREEWRIASPAMKHWIESGAKVLKIEKESLENSAKKEDNQLKI